MQLATFCSRNQATQCYFVQEREQRKYYSWLICFKQICKTEVEDSCCLLLHHFQCWHVWHGLQLLSFHLGNNSLSFLLLFIKLWHFQHHLRVTYWRILQYAFKKGCSNCSFSPSYKHILHIYEHYPQTSTAHRVVVNPDHSRDNLPIEKRNVRLMAASCVRDVGGVIRSHSDSYSDSEIVIMTVPLSPEGAKHCTCCMPCWQAVWLANPERAAAWCLFQQRRRKRAKYGFQLVMINK